MITVTPSTRISVLLNKFPQVLDAVVAISPAFQKLKNPILRKLMAGRVSIRQAAKMGNCSLNDFHRVFSAYGIPTADFSSVAEVLQEPGVALSDEKKKAARVLDVRVMLDAGKDPLDTILETLRQLEAEQVLCLVNTFEPVPLLRILSKSGYRYEVEQKDGLVLTWIIASGGSRLAQPKQNLIGGASFEAHVSYFSGSIHFIDVRDMEMPRPLLTILQALETLPPRHALMVEHRKLPVFLLPELQERNFACDIHEADQEQVMLLIYRSADLDAREDQ